MSHHKKNSTFANVPFAESNGLDDFIGFSVEETNLKQEIIALQDIVYEKDKIIRILRTENDALKNQLRSKRASKSSTASDTASDHNNLSVANLKSVKLQSPTSQTTEGSALFSKTFSQTLPMKMKSNRNSHLTKSADDELKHQISASLNNFLDTLDFKFKEDDEDMMSAVVENTEDNEDEIYVIHPPNVMDIDGNLPQLRRSSLTEEEQQQMELQAVNDMKSKTKNANNQYIATTPYNNVIFNDSSVNNMNMNIINHHNHQELDQQVIWFKNEIIGLQNEIQRMKLTKIELIITTSNEINHLRNIIRTHTK